MNHLRCTTDAVRPTTEQPTVVVERIVAHELLQRPPERGPELAR